MSPQKLFFVITYLLKDEQELSLGMLVFTPFALCFVTLRGVFMQFPELTY
jgi:hypothetical protein